MFVFFGVINGSIMLNQALTSFITIINQLKWLWEVAGVKLLISGTDHSVQ